MNEDNLIYQMIKKLGLIKCPECKSKNVKEGTLLDFGADKCSDCGLEYTSALRNRFFPLLFIWSLVSAPLVIYLFPFDKQSHTQVWALTLSIFIVPFITSLIIQRTRRYKRWGEEEAKADKFKFNIISRPII